MVASAKPEGLALFAGISAEPLVDDVAGRAMQLGAVLRELRGSAHLLAVVASGLTGEMAHFLKRPSDYKMFGYDEATAPVATAEHQAQLAAAESLTDAIVRPAVSVLDAAGAGALAKGAAAMLAALS